MNRSAGYRSAIARLSALLAVGAGLVLIAPAPAQEPCVTDSAIHTQPPLAKPTAGVPYVDPAFGTPTVRVSDAKSLGLPGVIAQYSKRQAWNADESLLLLQSTDCVAQLFDGHDYRFLRS